MKQRNVEVKEGKRTAEIFYNPIDKTTDPNERKLQTPRIFTQEKSLQIHLLLRNLKCSIKQGNYFAMVESKKCFIPKNEKK